MAQALRGMQSLILVALPSTALQVSRKVIPASRVKKPLHPPNVLLTRPVTVMVAVRANAITPIIRVLATVPVCPILKLAWPVLMCIRPSP